MTQADLLKNLEETFKDCLEIARRKNSDYAGSDNAFRNFEFSELVKIEMKRGVLIRMTDKIARISNLLDKEAQVKDESVIDTLKDLINYAAILKAMYEDGKGKDNSRKS